MKTEIHEISFNSSTITRILAAAAVVLILASIGGQLLKFTFGADYLKRFVLLFNLDEERNIPTYFSVLLMHFVALLLALITVFNKKQMMPHVSKWAILSFGFLLMAFDESSQFHERLIWPFRAMLKELSADGATLGVFYFTWVIPGIILVTVLGLFFLKFLLYLPTTVRIRFLIAAILYIGGAIGFELIGGRHSELYGEENWGYIIITTIEESLELSGLIFFIWALLKYCEDHFSAIQLRFET
ncbi:MAG: multidrug transporter [Nitrosomonas sp.]|nr:multidrug transporter [Nitrosomonas sp.]MBP6075969.1 multidrug transporter [Nitrosomonas sp.]